MPRLSKARFTRLEYNWKKSIVSDEILDFHSMDTLLKMENGGGKSVLTQMMLSAYLPARKRSFNARPFAEYFGSAKPTFLLQEWKRDADIGYFCVGQMIRQAQSVREDSQADEKADSRLDHIVWIAEYRKQEDEISLASLQLLEKQPNGRLSFMKYADGKSMLEGFSRNRPSEFRIYNMNNSSQRKAYFERLEHLGIRLSEMVQLREFNQEESGISKFNSIYNTEDKLIRKVLIPAVQERLDADAGAASLNGHVETFKESFVSLLEEKRRNSQNLLLSELLGRLEEDLEEVHQLSERRLLEKKQLDERMMDLRLLYEGIRVAESSFGDQLTQLEEYLEACRAELIRLNHQLLSIRYHENHDQLVEISQQLDALRKQQDEKNSRMSALEKKGQLLRCAAVLAEIHAVLKEEKTAQEKLKAAQLSSEETARKQNAVGSALHLLYSRDSEEARIILARLGKEKGEANSSHRQIRKELSNLSEKVRNLYSERAVVSSRIEEYQKKESAFLKKNSLKIDHSLSFFSDLEAYRLLELKLIGDSEKKTEALHILENQKIDSVNRQQESAEKIQNERLKLRDTAHQIELAQARQKDLDSRLSCRKKLLAMLGLNEEDLWNDQIISSRSQHIFSSIQDHLASVSRTIADLERELRQLNTGTSLELSEDIREIMEELGIPEQTGTEILRSWKMPPARKEKFIIEHPFLPYSLVMDDTQIEPFISLLNERNINTSMPIPILSRESLNQEESVSGNLQFYLRFNTQLVFDKSLKALKTEKEEAIAFQKNYLQREQNELSELQSARLRADDSPVSLDMMEKHRKLQKDLQNQKQKTERILQDETIVLEQEKQKEKELIHQIRQAEKAVAIAADLCNSMKILIDDYQDAASQQNRLCEIEGLIRAAHNDQEQLESRSRQFEQRIIRLGQQEYEQSRIRDGIEDLCSRFERFSSFEPAKDERIQLEASFESLQAELDQSQSGEFARQADKAASERKRKQRQLDKYMSAYGLNMREIEPVVWNEDLELENDEKIRILKDSLSQLGKQILEGIASQSALSATEKTLLERIQEETGQERALERNEIRLGDLQAEKQQIQTETQKIEQEVSSLIQKQEQFGQVASRISDLAGLMDLELDEQVILPVVSGLHLSELETRYRNMRVAWQHQIQILSDLNRNLKNNLDELLRIYEKDSEYAQKTLYALVVRIDDISGMNEEIEQKQILLHTLLESIRTNLEKLQSKKQEVIQNLYGYLRSLHQQLKNIDMDTTVQIGTAHRKMLEITLPDWNSHNALYREKLTQYVEDGLERLEKNAQDQDSQIYGLVSPGNLYNSVVGISSIRIRLYKIEEFSQLRIDWHDAGKMSGAEGFLCALTVILAVLNYQHKTNADILSKRKDSSLLLLDNPFAYTQSAHIIDTMMKLASNMNTQMVAFTNVDNSAILNAFDNIYSLRMIPRYDGKNYLNISSVVSPDLVREAESVEILVRQSD